MKQAALSNGAIACSISGSGSSIFALSKGVRACKEIAKAMSNVFASAKIKSDVYISAVNNSGVKVI